MSQQYPVSAQELLSGSFAARDDFFLLSRVEKSGAGTSVIVEPDFPIIVNKPEMRETVFQATGVKLATRPEFSGKKPMPADLSTDLKGMYTGASGAALWIKSPEESESRIYLVQNDSGKPVNPLKWNFASGLASGDLIQTSFCELNQETGILFPTLDGKSLVGLNFRLPTSLPNLDAAFTAAVLGERESQYEHIQKQLAKFHPEHVAKPISWRTVSTEEMPGNEDAVSFRVLGSTFNAKAHVLVDNKARSANVHPVLFVNLANIHMSDVDLRKPVVVDPEKFQRNAGLFTLQEAARLMIEETKDSKGLTPAPADHITRRAVQRIAFGC